MKSILGFICTLISIYSLLCTIRIILTWIPGMAYNAFGRFLSAICDPFLNIFSRSGFLRFGNIDFSPILSLGILVLLQNILQNIALTGVISFSGILAMIIRLIFNVFYSIVCFIIVITIVRLIITFTKWDSYSNRMLNGFDNVFNPLVYKIARVFIGKRPVSYRSCLIIMLAVLLVSILLAHILVYLLVTLVSLIPF